jgi:hypothetical protein
MIRLLGISDLVDSALCISSITIDEVQVVPRWLLAAVIRLLSWMANIEARFKFMYELRRVQTRFSFSAHSGTVGGCRNSGLWYKPFIAPDRALLKQMYSIHRAVCLQTGGSSFVVAARRLRAKGKRITGYYQVRQHPRLINKRIKLRRRQVDFAWLSTYNNSP